MEGKSKQVHGVNELGEFGLINRLTKNLKLKQPSSVYGVGDDCAVLEFGKELVLITTDLLTEGIHFNFVYTPIKHLGYKAVVVNLSDIYAMNGEPTQITISLAMSGKFSQEAIDMLYEGINLACEKYGVDIVGGDTSSSVTGMTLNITAIGKVDKEKVTYRHGAQNNDIICVSGNLGAAYMGLQVLERERTVFEKSPGAQPDLDNYQYVLERQLKPEARKDVVEVLKEKEVKPTSMIDISDGLSSELMHICEQSNKGCKIYDDKIPIDPETIATAEELQISALTAALNGGEDYELLFTVPMTDLEKINHIEQISMIGHITEDKNEKYLILQDGSQVELKAQGWTSFK